MWFQQQQQQQRNGGEGTPLLAPSNASGNGSTKYYFLSPKSSRDKQQAEIEGIPEGSHTDEFAPKQLPPLVSTASQAS